MRRVCLVAAALMAVVPFAGAQYKVVQTAKVGGAGGFDYVNADSAARKLYIAVQPGRHGRIMWCSTWIRCWRVKLRM